MIEVMAMKKLRKTRQYRLLYSPRKCFMMTKNEHENKKKKKMTKASALICA